MSKEFPNQDPSLPPGVSGSDPHFTGPDYESEIDIDYANKIVGWLEEAEDTIQSAIEALVSLGEYTHKIAEEDMKIVKEVASMRDTLEYAIKIEESKIDGTYDDYSDDAYDAWRDSQL